MVTQNLANKPIPGSSEPKNLSFFDNLKSKFQKYRKYLFRGVALIIVAFLLFRQWDTTVAMDCTLDVAKNQFLIVAAQESGIIKQIKVKDGDWVEQGTVLAVCEDLERDKQVIRMQAELEKKQLQIAGLQSQRREQQSAVDQAQSVFDQRFREADELRAEERAISNGPRDSRYPPELLELSSLVNAKQSDEQLQKSQQKRIEDLLKGGLISPLEVDVARNRSQIAEHERRAAQERFSSAQIIHARRTKSATTEEKVAEKALQVATQKLKTLDAEISVINEQIESSKKELVIIEKEKKLLNIEAPREGLIIGQEMEKKLGQYLERGNELCRIADIIHLQANADVPEWDINNIQVENPARLRMRLINNNLFSGYIKHINTEALIKPENNQRVYKCEIAVNNKQKLLRPGMSGVAKVMIGKNPGYMIVWNWVKKSIKLEYWMW